jgi:hypothetical protein
MKLNGQTVAFVTRPAKFAVEPNERYPMQSFNLRLPVEKAHLTFYFNESCDSPLPMFIVTTISRENKTYLFQMIPQERQWKIIDRTGLPDWILTLEHSLAAGILENVPAMALSALHGH